jgi:hypothetical protein
VTVAGLVEEVKKGSSKWLKLQPGVGREFAWQSGYATFSLGKSQLETAARYIHNQREHHRKVPYQQEVRVFLDSYGIDYDERYIWD